MNKSKYSDVQIMAIQKQAENGVPVGDLCREQGMSSASFYKWRSTDGGMDAKLMAGMKVLDEENKRLKKMYAEKNIQNDLLKEALGKKWRGHLSASRWPNERCTIDLPVLLWRAVRSASARPAIGISQSSAMRTS